MLYAQQRIIVNLFYKRLRSGIFKILMRIKYLTIDSF